MLSWRKVTISLPLNPQEASGPYKEVQESLSVHNQPFSVGPLPRQRQARHLDLHTMLHTHTSFHAHMLASQGHILPGTD